MEQLGVKKLQKRVNVYYLRVAGFSVLFLVLLLIIGLCFCFKNVAEEKELEYIILHFPEWEIGFFSFEEKLQRMGSVPVSIAVWFADNVFNSEW